MTPADVLIIKRLEEASAIIRDVQPVLEAVQRIMEEDARKSGTFDPNSDGPLLVRIKNFNKTALAVRPEEPKPFGIGPTTVGVDLPKDTPYKRPDAQSFTASQNFNPFGVKGQT